MGLRLNVEVKKNNRIHQLKINYFGWCIFIANSVIGSIIMLISCFQDGWRKRDV